MCSVFIVERQRLFTDNSSLELWHSITSYSPNIFGAGSRIKLLDLLVLLYPCIVLVVSDSETAIITKPCHSS